MVGHVAIDNVSLQLIIGYTATCNDLDHLNTLHIGDAEVV